MTEPVRPLEALIVELLKTWRWRAVDWPSPDFTQAADELAALLQAAAPPAPTAEKCPMCGAPTLKPGERHAKVLPPRTAPPFYLEPDEDSIPAAPPKRVSEGKEPAQDLDWLKGLAEWHTRTAAMERDPVLAAFHATAAEMLGAL